MNEKYETSETKTVEMELAEQHSDKAARIAFVMIIVIPALFCLSVVVLVL